MKTLLAVLVLSASCYAQVVNPGGGSGSGGSGTVTSIATTGPITGGTITTTGTIACATCTTAAVALTSGQVVIGQSGQAQKTISDLTFVPGTSATFTDPVLAPSVSTGASPPTCAAGTGGVWCAGEGTAPTGASAVDMLYADSTAHRFKVINNNAAVTTIAQFTDNLSVFSSGGAIAPLSVNSLTITTSTGTLTVPNGVVLTGPSSSGTVATLGNAETITGLKTFNTTGQNASIGIFQNTFNGTANISTQWDGVDSTPTVQTYGMILVNEAARSASSVSGTMRFWVAHLSSGTGIAGMSNPIEMITLNGSTNVATVSGSGGITLAGAVSIVTGGKTCTIATGTGVWTCV